MENRELSRIAVNGSKNEFYRLIKINGAANIQHGTIFADVEKWDTTTPVTIDMWQHINKNIVLKVLYDTYMKKAEKMLRGIK